ncbi:MAG: hypothetical protein B6244_07065 [Candidatus Cloacimonetes bacterium 4572_55]|nr:MAG: hypothetical protein B6244_07065 [Candidatus Cloacimonetes bacterium 4572_55]
MILSYNGVSPQFGESNLVAPGAFVIGDVVSGDYCSFWFNAVVRGDVHYVRIGNLTNIQDNCVIHEAHLTPVIIGDQVTVGHGATIHACTIQNRCLIGINSTILDNADVGEGSIIAANSVVRPHTKIPERTLMAGVPAKPVREVTDEEYQNIIGYANRYRGYMSTYLDGIKGAEANLFLPLPVRQELPRLEGRE